MWTTADRVALLDSLAREPFAWDFYQAMRRLECLFPEDPRWGESFRPHDEPIRLGQEPSLAFAPASISALKRDKEGAPPRMEVRFFGMLGPNGPMPLHLTEYARARIIHANDATFARFLDLINHRFIALFYRAWAQAQPTVSLDRPGEDRFAGYVSALLGLGTPALRNRDSVSDNAKRFHAGNLARQVRDAEGLAQLLGSFFGFPVRVEQYVGHWMRLEPDNQTRLGRAGLGQDAVLGRSVWDRQSKFRLHIGPMDLKAYEDFLPVGNALQRLAHWVRLYTQGELFWDVRLILRQEEARPLCLGRAGRIGWTGWLGKRKQATHAGDLVLDAERLVAKCHDNTGA